MNKSTFGKLVDFITDCLGFPHGSVVKNPLAKQETWVQSLSWEDPLEKEMATHSSILAWEILWTEEPGTLQSMRLLKNRTLWLSDNNRQNFISDYLTDCIFLKTFSGFNFLVCVCNENLFFFMWNVFENGFSSNH